MTEVNNVEELVTSVVASEAVTTVTETTTTTLQELQRLDVDALNAFVHYGLGFLLFFVLWSCCKWAYRFLKMFF